MSAADDAHPAGTSSEQAADPTQRKSAAKTERPKRARSSTRTKGEDLPITTQTDQLVRSAEMEQVGPTAWMNEMERRIAERQGDAPDRAAPGPRRGAGAQRPR